jgi:hypothetical protein
MDKKKYFEKNKGRKQNNNYENIKKAKEDSKSEQRRKDLEQEEKFRSRLLQRKYVLHVIKRDGNCLFSSVSDQVYGTDKHSSIIREKCMDYIEKNKLFYSQFIEGGETQIPAYIQRKRKNGIWGDNLEIQALSEIYNRPIEIYVNVDKPIRSFCNDGDKTRYPIKISYHGNKHYNSIVPSVKSDEFSSYKKELINTLPGIYETDFIKQFDPNKKFGELFFNFNENNFNIDAIFQDNIAKNEEFLLNEAIENSKIITSNNINNIYNEEENEKNELKEDEIENYLQNPIIQKTLDFGFDLTEAIEAIKICGNNQDLVLNYLYDKK